MEVLRYVSIMKFMPLLLSIVVSASSVAFIVDDCLWARPSTQQMAPNHAFYVYSVSLLHKHPSVFENTQVKLLDCKILWIPRQKLEWEHKDKLDQDSEVTDPACTKERIDREENIIDVDLTGVGVTPIKQPGENNIIYIPDFFFSFVHEYAMYFC